MQGLAQRKNVHAEWRQKLSNKFGYSKQFVKFSKINVYIRDVFGSPEGCFGLKLVAGKQPETSGAQVGQKVWKRQKNEGPRPLFGALWAPTNSLGRV